MLIRRSKLKRLAVFFLCIMVSRSILHFSSRRGSSMPRVSSLCLSLPQQQLNHFVKRKLAIVVSYVGTNYYGLQMDTSSTLDTIEGKLESALFDSGCILETNRGQLQKIGWSRSSRTDRGVSCARMVVSAKLEIDINNWIQEQKAPLLVDMLNERLPNDIRVHAVCKVNQGFRARESCHWREYEYVFPLKLITQACEVTGASEVWSLPPVSAEEAVARLNKVLCKFEGSHSFHNFHKLSPKDLRSREWKPKKLKTEVSASDPPISINSIGIYDNQIEEIEDAINEKEQDEEEKEIKESLASEMGGEEQKQTKFFEPSWIRRERDVCAKTRSTIYLCHAETARNIVKSHDSEEEMLVIRIRGQAFLLHQIRLMVAAAILIVRGILPEVSIDVALSAPYHINFPLAPAEGLLLVNAGFGRNSNTYALASTSDKEAQIFLMSDEEYEQSEQFKLTRIYPQLIKDWGDKNKNLQNVFFEYCKRFECGELVHDEWQTLVRETKESDLQKDKIREGKEFRRINKAVDDFRKHLLHLDSSFQEHVPLSANDDDGGGSYRVEPYPHKRLLPNSLATELVLNFEDTGMLPGSPIVTEVLRALATKMVLLEIKPTATAKELVKLVESNGGLLFWKDLPKHRMIE